MNQGHAILTFIRGDGIRQPEKLGMFLERISLESAVDISTIKQVLDIKDDRVAPAKLADAIDAHLPKLSMANRHDDCIVVAIA